MGEDDATTPSEETGIVAWLKVEWHQPLLAVGAALGLISSGTEGWVMGVLIAASVLATFIGSLRVFKTHSDVLRLRNELATAKTDKSAVDDRVFELEKDLASTQGLMGEMLWALLTMVRDELHLGPQERISVYVHDEELAAFQMLARSSVNPAFEKRGRTVYADGVGVIGHAWTGSGEVVESGLPPWEEDGRAYVAENLARFGLPEAECRGLNMKSRSLIGIRYPMDGAGARPLGVLVLESMDADWATNERLDELKKATSWATLRDYLHSQRKELPLMSGAKGKGF